MVTPNDSLTVATFKNLPVLNDAKSTIAKRPIYDDVEVCEIKFAANKQTVGVFPAHESIGWVDDPDGGRHEETYAKKYHAQYLAFKDGVGQAQLGTPLAVAPFLTAGKRLELQALNIYTLEALASLDGAPLKRLGMGGRDLQKEAALYLEAQPGVETSHLVDVVARQDEDIAAMRAELDALKAEKALSVAPPPPPPAAAASTKTPRKAKAKKAADKPSPFADFDNVDILNWLKEGDAADEFVTKWPIHEVEDGAFATVTVMSDDDRAELIAHADEIAAKLSKKAN